LLEVEEVLLPLRLVEAELARERLLQLRRRVRHAREVGDRVARQRAEQDEVQGDRDEDRAEREEDPLDEVVGAPHAPARPGRPSSVTPGARTRGSASTGTGRAPGSTARTPSTGSSMRRSCRRS